MSENRIFMHMRKLSVANLTVINALLATGGDR